MQHVAADSTQQGIHQLVQLFDHLGGTHAVLLGSAPVSLWQYPCMQVWNSDTLEDARKAIQSELVSDEPEMRLLYTTPGEHAGQQQRHTACLARWLVSPVMPACTAAGLCIQL